MQTVKTRSTASTLTEIVAVLYLIGGIGIGFWHFATTQQLFISGAIVIGGILVAAILNVIVEILQSLWRMEAHLAKGNYDYTYVNKLKEA